MDTRPAARTRFAARGDRRRYKTASIQCRHRFSQALHRKSLSPFEGKIVVEKSKTLTQRRKGAEFWQRKILHGQAHYDCGLVFGRLCAFFASLSRSFGMPSFWFQIQNP